MANTNLNPNPGPVAVGMNQGAPVGLGAQKASSIQQYDAAGNVVQVATIQPAVPFLLQLASPGGAGSFDSGPLPFDCQVVDAFFQSTGTAPATGDTFAISTLDLAGSASAFTSALQAIAATGSLTRIAAATVANGAIVAGGKVRLIVAQGTHSVGLLNVLLIPTAL